jgi:hypothetical protein
MTGNTQVICLGSEAKYFCKWGWTGNQQTLRQANVAPRLVIHVTELILNIA